MLLTVALVAAGFQYTIWLRRHGVALETEVDRANRNADLANRNRRLANRHLHAAQLRLSSQAIENGQLERAQDILQSQIQKPDEDDPRDFAWHVLWERSTRQIAPLYGHERDVRALSLSPDGRTLSSGDEVGVIRLWDLRTGSPVRVMLGHALSIRRLVFSADGALMAAAADSESNSKCEVLVWEVATGRELARIEGLDNGIEAEPVFLRNQSALRLHASWREPAEGVPATREIRTYDLSHGPSTLILRSKWRWRDAACLSRSGAIVSFPIVPSTETDRWTMKDAESGLAEWTSGSAHPGTRVMTASTADGRIIAAAFADNTVSCRETQNGGELLRYTSENPPRSLALSSDGRMLAAACDSGVVELRSLATGRCVKVLLGKGRRQDPLLVTAFSPDGTRLATTEWAVPGGSTPVTIWEVDMGKWLAQYPGHRDRAADLQFAADGRSLLIAAGPTIRRWWLDAQFDPATPAGHTDEAWAVAFSPGGDLLASGSDDDDSHTIKLWNSRTGALVRGWYGGSGTTAALEFFPDGLVIASAHLTKEHNVRIWEVATGKLLAILSGHTAAARTLAFHHSGTLLASAGSDRTIRFWDLEQKRCVRVLTGHDGTVQHLVFAPGGAQVASGSSDATVPPVEPKQRRAPAHPLGSREIHLGRVFPGWPHARRFG